MDYITGRTRNRRFFHWTYQKIFILSLGVPELHVISLGVPIAISLGVPDVLAISLGVPKVHVVTLSVLGTPTEFLAI